MINDNPLEVIFIIFIIISGVLWLIIEYKEDKGE